MGVRETLNENRVVKIVVVSGLVLFGVIWIMRSTMGGSTGQFKAFYTVDDGATWFADDADKLAPFDHNGKQAVQCFVYKTGPNGKPWVSHLQRMTPEGLKQRQQQLSDKSVNAISAESIMRPLVEVKEAKTDEKSWVMISDPRAKAILELKNPDGSAAEIFPVDPNE